MVVDISNNTEAKDRIEAVLLIPDFKAWRLYLPEVSSGKISLVDRYDHSQQDCIDYALGIQKRNCKGASCLNLYPDINEPQEGDIALYLKREKDGDIIAHAGIYQKDTTIVSRWGTGGPIFNHPIDFVPRNYGDYVIFRRI